MSCRRIARLVEHLAGPFADADLLTPNDPESDPGRATVLGVERHDV